MTAAACLAPDDCWFGGIGGRWTATGERRGAFHLHWDGANLETVYAPQGRGVTDLEVHRGALWETVRVGKTPGDRSDQVDLFEPEPEPRLIHRITGGVFANDPFLPASTYIPLATGAAHAAADHGGRQRAARAGLGRPADLGGGRRRHLGRGGAQRAGAATAACRAPRGHDLEGGGLPAVAAVHDRRAVRGRRRGARHVDARGPQSSRSASASTGAHARVARLQPDGAAEVVTLPASGPGRGTAAKVAFTGPNEGWMVTAAGWLFHFTDGTVYPRNTDPAYAGTITFRPNEAAEQFIPDTPPADDSELFAPPPVELEQAPAPAAVKRLPALLRRIKTSIRGRTLTVRFTLSRRARVQIIGRRKGRTVARTRARTMRPGRHVLRLRLDPKRWPQRLSFRVREQRPGRHRGTRRTVATPCRQGATATRSPPTATRSPRARAGERGAGPPGERRRAPACGRAWRSA